MPALDDLVLSNLDKSSLCAIIPDLIVSALCPNLHDLKFKDANASTIAALSACLQVGANSPSMRVVVAADVTDSDDTTHQLIHALRSTGIDVTV